MEAIKRLLELQAEVDRLRDQVETYAREKRSTALVLYRPPRRRGA